MNVLFIKVMSRLAIGVCLIISSYAVLAEHNAKSHELATSLNNTWNGTFNTADSKALSRLYTEGALLSPGNGKILQGREEIAGLFQSFIDNGVHNHSIEIVESHMDAGMLYQIGYWQAHGKETDGVSPTFGGVVTLISQKDESGQWKLLTHTWNMSQ